MTKILFICHGNICRSPMAEFVMKKLVSDANLQNEFIIDSASSDANYETKALIHYPQKNIIGIPLLSSDFTFVLKADNSSYPMPTGSESGEITRKTVFNEGITAPIKKGDTLGFVEIYIGDELKGNIPLTAKNNVDKLTFGSTVGWILKSLFIL